MALPCFSPSQHVSRARGFTLIELLVALTGGLFVSIAVFAFARDASRFYQREGRMASATLAGLAGFERLRSDIARAGFLATPNVQDDPFVCSIPSGTAPVLLQNLAAVRIVRGGSPDNDTLDANGIDPDSIVLAGSYTSPDEFPVRAIVPGDSNTVDVYLQTESGPMARLGFADAADPLATLTSVFAPGRGLRIVDNEGRQHYGMISDVSIDADAEDEPYITLSSNPPLEFRPDSSKLCGLKGVETGATVNVINFIQYDIRNLSTQSSYESGESSSYAPLYADSAGAPFEANRTELVRTELDAEGDPLVLTVELPDTTTTTLQFEELVAEYAVDLHFEVTMASAGPDPVLSHTDDDVDTAAGAPLDDADPQRLRSVRARLSVRSREADRAVDFGGGLTGIAAGLYRLALGEDGDPPYARVRTLQAEVMLQNQKGASW